MTAVVLANAAGKALAETINPSQASKNKAQEPKKHHQP